jgi:hypothetical protein
VRAVGDKQTEAIRPDFDRSICIVACVGFIVSRMDFGKIREALAHFNWSLAPVGLASLFSLARLIPI